MYVANPTPPHVVIIGGGFGGLYAARALGNKPVRVTLIDRKNHHTFQPLLYQVATAGLSPGEIAAPIRGILARYRNIEVLLGEVVGVDPARNTVQFARNEATGAPGNPGALAWTTSSSPPAPPITTSGTTTGPDSPQA
jgi:NADH dehydrogenase FAD-containing subunit